MPLERASAAIQGAAVAVPRGTPAGGIRETTAWVAEDAHRGADVAVLRVRFEPLYKVPVECVLGHDPAERARRRDHMIDPPGGLGTHADIANRRLAQRPDLELEAVHRAPRGRPTAGCPIGLTEGEVLWRAPFMVKPHVTSRRPVNRMADVVDPP